jgi:hypothetical protein
MNVAGIYRAKTLPVSSLVCFYEKTGHDSGMLVYNGLASRLADVEYMSYQEETDDYTSIEKKIGSYVLNFLPYLLT